MAKTASRRNKHWVREPNGILKLLALATSIVCTSVVTWYLPIWTLTGYNGRSRLFLVVITFGGYVIVLYAQIIGYVLDGTMGTTRGQEMMTSGIGALLHASAGIVLLDSYKDTNWGETTNALIACASLAFLNSAILTTDAIIAVTCYPSRKHAYIHPSAHRTVINNTNNNHNVFYLPTNTTGETPLTVTPLEAKVTHEKG